MASTIVSALLPVVVTLVLGYVAGWHRDFDGKHAAILNRMVMPLNLFAGMIGHGGHVRDRLRGRAIHLWTGPDDLLPPGAGDWRPGGPVLSPPFGTASTIPISVASLVMNLIEVPVTLILLSAGPRCANSS